MLAAGKVHVMLHVLGNSSCIAAAHLLLHTGAISDASIAHPGQVLHDELAGLCLACSALATHLRHVLSLLTQKPPCIVMEASGLAIGQRQAHQDGLIFLVASHLLICCICNGIDMRLQLA